MRRICRFVIALVFCCVSLSLSSQKRLSFHEGKFKIAQFTDIHWDQKSSKCEQTIASIQAVLEAEHPDVAMLTGDIVTAEPAEEGWNTIIGLFEAAELPFAVMMGNHDGEVLPKDKIYTRLRESPYFIGEKGPVDIQGFGNYVIPVYGSDGGDNPVALLYCLDSNDYPTIKEYGTYDWIHFNQIEWYRKQSAYYTKENGGQLLPSLAFFHIPLPEYEEIVGAETTLGEMKEHGGSARINTGFFASLIEMGDVMCTFVGHNHNDDCIGMLYGKGLAYGRVSGWSAYGDFERGGRIIELREGKFEFDSWIRTSLGKEYTYYYPSGLTSKDEETMEYLPAISVNPKRQGVAYTYYEGRFKRTDQIESGTKVKEGTMGNFSIDEASSEDHFAYIFRTWINIPEKGVYRFYTYSDDGTRLRIDNKEVVDNDGGHNARLARGKVALDAGFHELCVLYFEDYMGQELEVGISSRSILEQPLPDEMLYLPEEE